MRRCFSCAIWSISDSVEKSSFLKVISIDSMVFLLSARKPHCESVIELPLLEARSSTALPSLRYAGIWSKVRNPMTKSAVSERIGSIRRGISAGSCWPSPSRKTRQS